MCTSTLTLVPSVSFDIEDVFDLGDGYQGVTLVGPPVDTSGGLKSGDILLAPTRHGDRALCECVDFPLVNLGPERVDWVRVSVTGVMADRIQIGSRASRVA